MEKDELLRLYNSLKQIDFFADLTVHELDLLIAVLKTEKAEAGKTIVKQGKKGDCLYLISRGSVSVIINEGLFKKIKTAELKDGDYFGEMALLGDQKRKASVVARTECEMIVLHRKDFWDIIMKNPAIEEKVNSTSKNRTLANEGKN